MQLFNFEIAVEFQFDNVDLCGKIDPIIRESRSGIIKSYASQQVSIIHIAVLFFHKTVSHSYF